MLSIEVPRDLRSSAGVSLPSNRFSYCSDHVHTLSTTTARNALHCRWYLGMPTERPACPRAQVHLFVGSLRTVQLHASTHLSTACGGPEAVSAGHTDACERLLSLANWLAGRRGLYWRLDGCLTAASEAATEAERLQSRGDSVSANASPRASHPFPTTRCRREFTQTPPSSGLPLQRFLLLAECAHEGPRRPLTGRSGRPI